MATVKLSESLPLSDKVTISKKTSTSLSESLPLADVVTISKIVSTTLSESLPLADVVTISKMASVKLSESLPLDTNTPSIGLGVIVIEARDQNNVLIPNAQYTVIANPYGGTSPLPVIDGGINDHDAINNGRIVVDNVPFETYNVTMTKIPAGYNVLGNSTFYTVYGGDFNATDPTKITVFRLVPVTYNLTTLPDTGITIPHLNDTVLDTWMNSFSAMLINKTETTITTTYLPPILLAGTSNTVGINNAIGNQSSIFLQSSSIPSMTNSSQIIQAIGAPTYSMPRDSSVISVIPSIVVSPSVSSPDPIVSTPPLDKIIPGQEMIIPVQQSLIPPTGGLKELNITSNSASPLGTNATSDWFVAKVLDTLPSSFPVLPSKDKLTLYVNVTYPHEVNSGFDWSNPSNFESPPQLTLQLPKHASGVMSDSNGCPISDVFLYDPSTGSWTTNTVSILSSAPTVGNSNTCDYVVQAHHFSQFALGSPTAAAPAPAPASVSVSYSGGGAAAGPSPFPSTVVSSGGSETLL